MISGLVIFTFAALQSSYPGPYGFLLLSVLYCLFQVLVQAQKDLTNYAGTGVSVMGKSSLESMIQVVKVRD